MPARLSLSVRCVTHYANHKISTLSGYSRPHRAFFSIAEEAIPGASSALDSRCGAEMLLINRDFHGLNISSTIGELAIPRIPVENPFGE